MKTKKVTPKAANDYILLDMSASMRAKWTETIGSINAYVKELHEKPEGALVKITLAAFDHLGGFRFQTLRRAAKKEEWIALREDEVTPSGYTPLYDAIGRIVALAEDDNPDNVCIIIITDGEENASRELNKESSKKVLDKAREKGWQVIFLGVDFDNFQQAKGMGNQFDQTIMVNAANMAGTMAATASMRGMFAAGARADMAYNQKDREAATKRTKSN